MILCKLMQKTEKNREKERYSLFKRETLRKTCEKHLKNMDA